MNNWGLNFLKLQSHNFWSKTKKISVCNFFRVSTKKTFQKHFWMFFLGGGCSSTHKELYSVSPNKNSYSYLQTCEWMVNDKPLPPGSPAAPWWWPAPGRGDPGRWFGPVGPWPCYTGCCSPPRTSPTPPACPRGPCCGLWTADRCCRTDPPTQTAWSSRLWTVRSRWRVCLQFTSAFF